MEMKLLLRTAFAICIVLEVLDFSKAVQTTVSKSSRHPPSILNRSVFTIVRFLNIPCASKMTGGQMTGVCFSLNDCVRLQGTQIGTCASGFGVCCIFQRTCGVATSQNLTHFTNPGYPNEIMESQDTSCTLTLMRPHKVPICQIRLDFLDFDIARPTEGNCLEDKLTVRGSNLNAPIPEICGYNTGQHMYIDVDNSIGPIHLTVNTKGPGRRKWNIKVKFIECNNPSRAPPNCLQYYTGVQGRISSFNYIPGQSPADSGGYLNNMDYAICIRKEVGRCSITYTAENNDDFGILNLDPETGAPTVGGGEAGLGVEECPMDYIRLGGDRYCGARLNPSTSQPNPNTNAPVTDTSTGPFIVYVKSDSDINANGFNLQYMQNACG